jgi:transcriptional regulator with XRE-family HTH domain
MAAKRQGLAQRRKAVGFSQEALAGVLDVERSTVVRWELGETEPLPWIRPKLARALGVSVDQLDGLLGIEPGLEPMVSREGAPWAETKIAPPPVAAAGGDGGPLPVCQLPPAAADFTGRELQIAQLTAMLSRDRENRVGVPVAVIVGLAGAGKTALAVHVAHLIRAAFPDGQLWAPLEGASGHSRDPGEVLGELIRALRVPGSAIPQSTAQRASSYRSRWRAGGVLVVAGDAATTAQVVQPLLPGTGRSAVLVTSRSELVRPPGSRLLLLDPLTRRAEAAPSGSPAEVSAAAGETVDLTVGRHR